jgi:branched-chain amino acid transport system ATP-binding protein
MSLLEVTDLEAGYGPVTVLRGISFNVDEGRIVTVLGPNGAGKTTTLRALSGIVRRAGEIRFDGKDVSGHSPEKMARQSVAHVPEGRGTFTGLTVEENLRVGAFPRRDRAEIAGDMKRCFGYFPRLEERRAQHAGSLSGGEQQMLAIARAMMLRPRLMLLDEPSLGLSPKLVRDIFDIVVRINRERGVTILLVEQNANMALQTADFGYVLEVGRIVMADTCQRLLEKEDIKEFYLGIKDQGARGKRRWKKRKTWR